MTADEFLEKYHNYSTKDVNQAIAECTNVNKQLVDCQAVVQHFESMGLYCLMLASAQSFLQNEGIL